MKVPWPTATLDPHAIDDASAAIFGAAAFDPLFALDPNGRPYPALAAGLPERVASGLRVTLRPNLMTARGRALDARDVLFALNRSRARAGVGVLEALGAPSGDHEDPLAVIVRGNDPTRLAVTLASPVTAIVSLPPMDDRQQSDNHFMKLSENRPEWLGKQQRARPEKDGNGTATNAASFLRGSRLA